MIKANKKITISGDILFFNKIPFFATIINNLKFTTIKCTRNMTPNKLTNSMVNVMSIYIKQGFNIKTDLMDR